MAYNGYLIKVGNYIIPAMEFIEANTYKVTKSIQDLDSYRDANGVLHRSALEHVIYKVEFNTQPNLSNGQMGKLFDNIAHNYTVSAERKAAVTLYVPEEDKYIIQDMYMPDPQITIRDIAGNTITYDSVRLAFIGY